MGVLRVERSPASGLAARASGVAWRDYDIQLTVYAVLLGAIGLAMAFSHTTAQLGDPFRVGTTFGRGLVWVAVALVAYAAATAFDYRWLRTLTWPIYAVNLALLVITLLVGDPDAASSSWVRVLGVQFQFSELAKILMIIVLARYLADRELRLDSLASILGACIVMAPPWILIMLQPDLGTSLVFFAILAGMLFMAGASLRWLGALTAAGMATLPFIWTYFLHDFQRERLTSFLDPGRDPLGAGFQLLTAQQAVSSGGLLGAGLTNGAQNQSALLPVQTTDFVFAILAEELGFVGGVVVFLLFAALIWRVLAIAWRSRDPFGLMVGAGIASLVLFQLSVNVGMVLGIMPITGIPLPFISHGGSSLTSMAIGLGVLQSIAIRQQRAEW
ncbi:MAG TPA: rod shape-determining protein RodA [Patescibacteria group bacterium]|nr:rod shape-determining protein RodA [Patescibacteria group bacterium]